MIQGIEHRHIFVHDKDRDNLRERLAVLLPKTKMAVLYLTLTPNHTHFLLHSSTVGLSTGCGGY